MAGRGWFQRFRHYTQRWIKRILRRPWNAYSLGPWCSCSPVKARNIPGWGPRFKAHLDRCLSQLKPHLPATLSEDDILSRTEAVHQTQLTQPALFILEYAL